MWLPACMCCGLSEGEDQRHALLGSRMSFQAQLQLCLTMSGHECLSSALTTGLACRRESDPAGNDERAELAPDLRSDSAPAVSDHFDAAAFCKELTQPTGFGKRPPKGPLSGRWRSRSDVSKDGSKQAGKGFKRNLSAEHLAPQVRPKQLDPLLAWQTATETRTSVCASCPAVKIRASCLEHQCTLTHPMWQHSRFDTTWRQSLWLLQESSSSGEVPHVLSDSAATIKTPSETPMLCSFTSHVVSRLLDHPCFPLCMPVRVLAMVLITLMADAKGTP